MRHGKSRGTYNVLQVDEPLFSQSDCDGFQHAPPILGSRPDTFSTATNTDIGR